MIVFFVGILLVAIGLKNIAFYLALTEPKQGSYLIVEGWQTEHSLKEALAVFSNKDNNYRYLITTGGLNTRQIDPAYPSYAEQSAVFLISQGLDSKKIDCYSNT